MATPDPRLVDLVQDRPIAGGQDLVESAVEHRLGGLLLSGVWFGQVQLAAGAERLLTATDLSNAAHHARLWSALVAAQGALGEEGIRVATLKGVTSEARWYSRIGERPCSDLDLWLAPRDLDQIERVLEVLAPGYPRPERASALVQERQLQHVHFEWCGVTVDLHLDPLKLGVWTRQLDEVWRSTTSICAPDGTMVRVLSPEIALVAALTHLNKDAFATLGAYVEIARIASTPDLDWDGVERFVRIQGLQICVWKSLEAVAQVLDVAVPFSPGGGWRSRVWDIAWPPDRRLSGAERDRTSKRQMLMPALMPGRANEAAREWCRVVVPSRALLDVHVPELSGHSTLRRMTWDRLSLRRERRRI